MKFNIIILLFFFTFFFNSCDKESLVNSDNSIEISNLFKDAHENFINGNSLECYEQFEKLYSKGKLTNNDTLICLSLAYLGEISKKTGDYERASKLYFEAYEVALSKSNTKHQAIALHNLAEIEPDTLKKLEKIKRGLSITDDKMIRENLLYYRAEIQSKLGNKDIAIDFYKQQVNKFLKKKDFYMIFQSYKHIGNAYLESRDYNEALENFNRSLEFLTDEKNIEIAQLYNLIGFSFQKLKKYSLAEENYFTALNANSISVDINIQKNIYKNQLELYRSLNNVSGQLEALLNLNEIEAKLPSEEKLEAVLIKNEYLLKEKNNLEEVNKLKSSQVIMLFFALISILFLSSIAFYLFNKNKSIQSELNLASINAFMDGQEEERKRYALQLHDSLGANLAAVNMHLSVLKKDVPEKSYNRVSKMLKNAIEETRHISHSIMPPVLVNQGLIVAITEKALEWDFDKLQFEVDTNVERVALDDKLEITLYRGVLECINNIIKHAKASKVHIIFAQQENSLEINIKDNGQGFDVDKIQTGKGGLGINGLKLRIHYFKGEFNIQSKKDKGTLVNISVPLLAIKQTG